MQYPLRKIETTTPSFASYSDSHFECGIACRSHALFTSNASVMSQSIVFRNTLYTFAPSEHKIESLAIIASLPCFIGDKSEILKRIDNTKPVELEWIWFFAKHKDTLEGNH